MPTSQQIQKAFDLFPGKTIAPNLKIAQVHIEEQAIRPYHLYKYTIMISLQPTGAKPSDIMKKMQRFLAQSHRILAMVNTYEVTVMPETIRVQPFHHSYWIRAEAIGKNTRPVPY